MQLKLHMVTIEDLVPADHFLRKLAAALDLSFVYEETSHMYCRRYGRPPIDPVVLVKYLLVGYLYGIPSERQIEERISDSIALRWYLGIDLDERVPDHSTISQLRRRKPSFRKVFRRLFETVVQQCIELGLASGRLTATDSTHVKANASRKSEYMVDMPVEPGVYWDRLDAYEEEGLEELARKTGKRRKKRTQPLKKTVRRDKKQVSHTDPEAGYLKRAGKPRGMHYLSHQTLDTDHGIILDVAVTPGDSSDIAQFLPQLERVKELLPVQAAAADSAYNSNLVQHELRRHGITLFAPPQKAAPISKTLISADAFNYDALSDSFTCPTGNMLTLRTLERNHHGLYWVYRAEVAACRRCPHQEQCIPASRRAQGRQIVRNYFEAARTLERQRLNTPEYKAALRLRQIWCEGTFAIQKRGHNLTRLTRRGIAAAEDHCLLSAAAMNLKRMIKCIGRRPPASLFCWNEGNHGGKGSFCQQAQVGAKLMIAFAKICIRAIELKVLISIFHYTQGIIPYFILNPLHSCNSNAAHKCTNV